MMGKHLPLLRIASYKLGLRAARLIFEGVDFYRKLLTFFVCVETMRRINVIDMDATMMPTWMPLEKRKNYRLADMPTSKTQQKAAGKSALSQKEEP
jgi:hypothetical protein